MTGSPAAVGAGVGSVSIPRLRAQRSKARVASGGTAQARASTGGEHAPPALPGGQQDEQAVGDEEEAVQRAEDLHADLVVRRAVLDGHRRPAGRARRTPRRSPRSRRAWSPSRARSPHSRPAPSAARRCAPMLAAAPDPLARPPGQGSQDAGNRDLRVLPVAPARASVGCTGRRRPDRRRCHMGEDVGARTFTREDRARYRTKVHRCLDTFAEMLQRRAVRPRPPDDRAGDRAEPHRRRGPARDAQRRRPRRHRRPGFPDRAGPVQRRDQRGAAPARRGGPGRLRADRAAQPQQPPRSRPGRPARTW